MIFFHLLSDQGTTVWRTAALGAAVILLFVSRACYNLTVVFLSQTHRVESFNFDWYNVSDQVNGPRLGPSSIISQSKSLSTLSPCL